MVNESLMTQEFALLGGVFIPYLHHSQAGTVARPPEGVPKARLLLVHYKIVPVFTITKILVAVFELFDRCLSCYFM